MRKTIFISNEARNKVLLIILGILILAAVWVGIFFYQKPSSSLVNPLTSQTTKSEAKLAVWEDPAGFKFSYPEEIKINTHPEDKENYAHLELTSSSHSGSILVWMKDTNYKTIEDWAKKQGNDVQVFDSDLGGNPAKKVASLNPKKLTTAAVDVDVLVLVELISEDTWWAETYNQILESFEFIPLQGEEAPTPAKVSGSSGQTNEGGVVDEGEEVVE